MGTPEFAAGILDTIIKHHFNVVGVITAADKPAGRGQKLKYSAVKEYALAHDLKILQPTSLKDPDFLSELKSLNANLQVVVAFRMLPEAVWRMPSLGTFNLHASLLPDYRGAAPINWAIINGDKKTGVTTFFIDDKIDTGEMILRREINIDENENAGSLHDRLMELGSTAVVDTLKLIESDAVKTEIQKDIPGIRPAPKLTKDNCRINWNAPAVEIFNQIRGLSPYPAAWTIIRDGDAELNIKIYDAEIHMEDHEWNPGKILCDKRRIRVACADGFINLRELQFPGKKKMTVGELLNGLTLADAAIAL